MAQPVYSDEELFRAAQAADAAGDTEAARKLTQALIAGKTQDQIETLAANLNQTIDKKALAANVASRDAGGPINRVVETLPTAVQPAATSAINTAVGYGSGAAKAVVDFPLQVASGVQTGANALLDTVIGGGLDVVGATDAADWWRNTGQVEEARRGALTSPVGTTVNALAPAPAGYETQRNVAEFAGGFLVPGPKGAKAPISAPKTAAQQAARPGVIDNAAEVVAEGNRRGVPVMTTDVKPPKSGMGRYVKQTLPEKIPVAGTSGLRAEQQAARQQAVADAVEEFGGRMEVSGTEISPVEDVSKALTTARSQRLTTLKTAKDTLIDGIKGSVATPRAIAEIDRQIADLAKLQADEVKPVIAKLQNWKSALAGETTRIDTGILDEGGKPIIREIPAERTLRVIEDLRKLTGEAFKDANLASVRTLGETALKKIYGPLREDMGAFIETQAGTAARAKWKRVNNELAAMVGELEDTAFKNALRKADVTPDVIANILFKGGDRGNASMRRVVANLDVAGKVKVQGALMTQAWRKAMTPQGVSVEKFLNEMGRLSDNFDIAFEGEKRAALKGLERLLNATRRGAEAGANVRTGEQNLPAVMGYGAASVPGGLYALGIGGLLARLYESAPTRNLFVRLASTEAGSVQESRALEVLMRSAAPIVNTWKENASRAVNDNAAGALAASEQEPVEPQ
jgi:hypothetical protein